MTWLWAITSGVTLALVIGLIVAAILSGNRQAAELCEVHHASEALGSRMDQLVRVVRGPQRHRVELVIRDGAIVAAQVLDGWNGQPLTGWQGKMELGPGEFSLMMAERT